jgi:hypothetical protein
MYRAQVLANALTGQLEPSELSSTRGVLKFSSAH